MATSGFTLNLPKVPSFKTPKAAGTGYRPPTRKATTAFGLSPDIKPIGERAPTHHAAPSVFHPKSFTGHASLGYTKSQLGTSASGGFSKHSSPFHAPSATQATLLQQLARQYAQKQQHSSGSLFDQIKSGAGSALGWTLDKMERPLYATASAVDAAASGHSILHGAEQGFTGANKETFGQVLQKHHILDGHSILRGIAGL